jgi:hypothetical protein
MKLNGMAGVLGTVFIVACVAAPPATIPVPANVPGKAQPIPTQPPAPPTPPQRPEPSGAWAFTYAPGNYSYSFATAATIAPVEDTTQKRPVPELNQRATITISATGDVQVLDPVIVTSTACDPNAALVTRAQQLIPKLPDQLVSGEKWRDSTVTTGCRGTIPAESTVISNYLVLGDTTLANTTALQIYRTDSLSATGEGVDGQHRIIVSAAGTGAANLFFNVAAGRLIGLTGSQTTVVNVTTSGRLTQFIQHVTESVTADGLR